MHDDAAPEHGPQRDMRRGVRGPWWIVHLVLVVLALGYVVLSTCTPSEDANIGLGLGMLALSVLAVPWSLPVLLSGSFDVDSGPLPLVAPGGALLNPLLHALVAGRVRRRNGR